MIRASKRLQALERSAARQGAGQGERALAVVLAHGRPPEEVEREIDHWLLTAGRREPGQRLIVIDR